MSRLEKMRRRAGKTRPAQTRRKIFKLTPEQWEMAHDKSVEFGRWLERNTWKWRFKKAVLHAEYVMLTTMGIYWLVYSLGGF
jgi:hypothetical protein